MVQPFVTTWYKIPGAQDKRLVCSVVGCIMNATITDGKRALCSQHITTHAMTYSISLRVTHDEASHRQEGHCINCGQCLWSHNTTMRVYECIPCASEGIMSAKNLMNLDEFTSVPNMSMMDGLPHIHADPISPDEAARSQKFSENYLAWRNGKKTS